MFHFNGMQKDIFYSPLHSSRLDGRMRWFERSWAVKLTNKEVPCQLTPFECIKHPFELNIEYVKKEFGAPFSQTHSNQNKTQVKFWHFLTV